MKQPSEETRVLEKITGFFPKPRWLQGYVRGKLRTDPAYPAVLAELRRHPQPVLDIGCGLGLLSFYLREHGVTVPIFGVDCDAAKIARAAEIATREYEGLAFAVQDARDVPVDFSAVVLLDVLHYLDDADQQRLLGEIASRIPMGGVVIIRNAPREMSMRFVITYLTEWFVRAVGWIKGGGIINMPTKEAVASAFRRGGFDEEIRPLWGNTPFNSYLFVFRRIDPIPVSHSDTPAASDLPAPVPARPPTQNGIRDGAG